MASQYRINPRARVDLDAIWFYIATHNERAANNLVGNITSRFEMLQQFPSAGRERPDLISGLRSFAVEPYTIYYRAIRGLEIVRVIHGSQDVTEDDFD